VAGEPGVEGSSTSTSYGANGGVSQENGQQLPWSMTIPAKNGFGIYALTAQSGGSGNIMCRITVNGRVVAEQTSNDR